MGNYYDRDGQPISMDKWARGFDKDDRQVALTKLDDDVHVSTVWLGIDHSFGSGPPLIFETMIFGGPLDHEEERYTTEAQAREGHERWVTRARAAIEVSES